MLSEAGPSPAPAEGSRSRPPEGPGSEAVLAHAHHGLEVLVAHAAAGLGHPLVGVPVVVDADLLLESGDDLVEKGREGDDLLVGQGAQVVGGLVAELGVAPGLGEVDEHDAPIGRRGPALDEPVGLKLLEQLVERLLTDVEQIGEFAGGDGAVHLEGGEHAAAPPGGGRQRTAAAAAAHVTASYEPVEAVEAFVKFCADRVHGDLLVREGYLSNRYLLVFGKRIYRCLPQGSSHSNRNLYVLRHTLFVVRCRTVAALAPPVPFTPPRARAGRWRGGPATQKGGRRVSFTLRPAPLPSRSGAMTPFSGCAAPPTHPKVMRRPPFPALSSRPVDAPDRGGGGRRSGAPGAGAQHRRGRSLHRGRAAP